MNLILGAGEYKDQIKSLWKIAFSESDTFLNWYFDNQWDGNNAIALLDSNRVLAALEMKKYDQFMRGNIIKSSYVVGVSVLPQYRHRGFATKIMVQSIVSSYNNGEVLSMLIPFSYKFYRRMGYELCFTHGRMRFGRDDIDLSQNMPGRVRRLSIDYYEKLNDIYLRFFKTANGIIKRNPKDWGYIFDSTLMNGGGVFGYFENDLCGYFTSYWHKGELRIGEICFLTPRARTGMLLFISKLLDKDRTFTVDYPSFSNAAYFTNEPKEAAIKPTVMARVVNTRLALKQINSRANLAIKVDDNFFPQNSGVFDMNGSSAKNYDFKMNINTFTKLYTGFTDTYELYFNGEIKGNREKLDILNSVFPKCNNYIYHIMSNEL
ncbi:MAG TPA: GNAT family N-acetyltransferase [Clostridiales bacterium]|nr:GNAT family N-acetyltransferase [Clostridiales bacterium]